MGLANFTHVHVDACIYRHRDHGIVTGVKASGPWARGEGRKGGLADGVAGATKV